MTNKRTDLSQEREGGHEEEGGKGRVKGVVEMIGRKRERGEGGREKGEEERKKR